MPVQDYGAAEAFGRENLGNCPDKYCPGIGTNNPQVQRKKPLSAAGLVKMKTYAAKEMKVLREAAPEDLPDGVQYLGGEVMSVLFKEGDEIYSVIFKWKDVERYAPL